MQVFRKIFTVFKIIFRALVVIVIVLLMVYNVYNLVQRYAFGNDMPTVFGYGAAVVVSGSMDTGENPETDIRVNDLVITHAENEYKTGDVITFRDSQGSFTTHRIIFVSADGVYKTRGDANNADDNFSVPQSAVVGKVVFVARGVGAAVSFIQTPMGLLIILACGIVLWIISSAVSGLVNKSADKKEKNNEQIED